MKSLYYYIVFFAFSTFSFWVAFKWEIPVDNQIAMFLMGCFCITLMVLLAYSDIKNYIKSRKNRPQTF